MHYIIVNTLHVKCTYSMHSCACVIVPMVFVCSSSSLCPTIYGHELVKAGLVLGLFGGTQKYSDSLVGLYTYMYWHCIPFLLRIPFCPVTYHMYTMYVYFTYSLLLKLSLNN